MIKTNPLSFSEMTQLLDNLDWGICIFDADARFLWVNRYVIRTSGRTRDFYLGKTVYDLEAQGILDRPIVVQAIQSGRSVRHVQRSCTREGRKQDFLVNARIVYDGYGNVQYCIADRIKLTDLEQMLKDAEKDIAGGEVSVEQSGPDNGKIICESPAMRKILQQAAQIADIDANVLLTGQSGTGKEVIAHYLYEQSKKFHSNIVEINCGSIPESLLESELFGYEKGAFTGALGTGKKGLIEAADKGVLFLDEINSMPMGLQAKLLRVLETKTITRIGSVKPIHVGFRLVAAANRDLARCVQEGSFREDLYYRLNVIPIELPPLCSRPEDIRPLTDYFLHKYCTMYGLVKEFAPSVYEAFAQYSWPGNVRELRNIVERLVVMSTGRTIEITESQSSLFGQILDQAVCDESKDQVSEDPHTIPGQPCFEEQGSGSAGNSPSKRSFVPGSFRQQREQAEAEEIREALLQTGGHRENTAQLLGISRRSLQYKLKKYGLLDL